MREVILNQAEQITHSLEVNKDVKVDPPAGGFDSMILAGMGGSGHPGDLLNALGITTRPLYVHRNYDLPLQYLGNMGFSKTLFIASSYSGNTEEPLTGYDVAQEKGIPILASAAGGQLRDWAARDGLPFCLIDFPGAQPRHTLFAAFTGIYAALRNSGLARNVDDELIRVAAVLEEKAPALETAAQELAQKLYGTTPVFLASDALGFAAKNCKIQANENSKYPAFWNVFPDLNHNELVGFSKVKEANNPNKFTAVFLHDPADHPRIKARMKVTADLYQQWGLAVEHFEAAGESPIERLFSTVTFGFWVTYFLALEQGVDPMPVDGVEDFKAKLKEVAGDA